MTRESGPKAAPTIAGANRTNENQGTAALSRVVDLDALSVSELDELGALLREEAARLRRSLPRCEAWSKFWTTELTPGWRLSRFAEIGRVRLATRRLLRSGWHPEQIVDPMLELAQFAVENAFGRPHPELAELVVAVGIADHLIDEEADVERRLRRLLPGTVALVAEVILDEADDGETAA